ncbi:MAG: hypothetical protein ACLUFN_08670 [Eubacterium sp.]
MNKGLITKNLRATPKNVFELYMKFLESICEREDMVGMSAHMLDIFRKN